MRSHSSWAPNTDSNRSKNARANAMTSSATAGPSGTSLFRRCEAELRRLTTFRSGLAIGKSQAGEASITLTLPKFICNTFLSGRVVWTPYNDRNDGQPNLGSSMCRCSLRCSNTEERILPRLVALQGPLCRHALPKPAVMLEMMCTRCARRRWTDFYQTPGAVILDGFGSNDLFRTNLNEFFGLASLVSLS